MQLVTDSSNWLRPSSIDFRLNEKLPLSASSRCFVTRAVEIFDPSSRVISISVSTAALKQAVAARTSVNIFAKMMNDKNMRAGAMAQLIHVLDEGPHALG